MGVIFNRRGFWGKLLSSPMCITPKIIITIGLKLIIGEPVKSTLYHRPNSSCYVWCIAGRRSCLGEQLTRQELFIFIATLVHRFNMTLPKGVKANYDSMDPFMLKPHAFQVIFESRLWCVCSWNQMWICLLQDECTVHSWWIRFRESVSVQPKLHVKSMLVKDVFQTWLLTFR